VDLKGEAYPKKQRKKKIKINCHLLRFLGFAGDGDPHRQQGREEEMKLSQTHPASKFLCGGA
jgi:hypothetical protein